MTAPVRLSLVIEGQDARAGAERLRVLAAVERAGSITGAGELLGLSYRGAWDSVQRLNALFGVPLVETSMGGSGGGGQASLTAAGRGLKRALAELDADLKRAAARLTANLLEAADWRSSPTAWDGRVEGEAGAELTLRSERGAAVVALSRGMRPAAGAKAAITIPPDAVLLTKGWIDGASARNQWRVRVAAREDYDGEVRLLLELPSGDPLTASLTRGSADRLALGPEATAIALVKASQVSVTVS